MSKVIDNGVRLFYENGTGIADAEQKVHHSTPPERPPIKQLVREAILVMSQSLITVGTYAEDSLPARTQRQYVPKVTLVMEAFGLGLPEVH